MIVATAGHVDHGKTLLVKALTGVDTDRLPEEKSRGLTIDLGFAYHDIGTGEPTGFIDVPGHEKFVRTMLAGVSGIDCVLFIVAADDGPMPQTLEHLAIMNLLRIEHGVFAVTKIDRVTEDRVLEVIGEIEELIQDTSLAGATIVPVSALEGIGVDDLREALLEASKHTEQRSNTGNFRLAVDRNFIIQGTGRVVTGTVFDGTIATEDVVRLLPADIELRVRGIHAQNTESGTAVAGQRCALNIVGGDLKRLQIHRGDWIVGDAARFTTTRIDTRVTVLDTEPHAIKNRTPVHLHIGAADIGARVVTLTDKEIAPGSSGLVQLQLQEPVNAVYGDRFVLRDQSAIRTIGGGYVIDPQPITRGRNKSVRMEYLTAQDTADPDEALANLLALELDALDLDTFARSRNLSVADTDALIASSGAKIIRQPHGRLGFSPEKWQKLIDSVQVALKKFHEKNPAKVGMNDGELTRSLAIKLNTNAIAALFETLIGDKTIERDGALLRLPDHRAVRSNKDDVLWNKISGVLKEHGKKSPVVHDLHTMLSIDLKQLNKFLAEAAKQGHLVRISDKRYYLTDTIHEFASHAEALATQNKGQGFTVREFRDRTGIGRNAVIEILEYFDRIGLTFRQDQIRKLRKSADEVFG